MPLPMRAMESSGTVHRNSLNSPATDVFEAALIEDFPITENLRTEFR